MKELTDKSRKPDKKKIQFKCRNFKKTAFPWVVYDAETSESVLLLKLMYELTFFNKITCLFATSNIHTYTLCLILRKELFLKQIMGQVKLIPSDKWNLTSGKMDKWEKGQVDYPVRE